jgi:hypothetical protein
MMQDLQLSIQDAIDRATKIRTFRAALNPYCKGIINRCELVLESDTLEILTRDLKTAKQVNQQARYLISNAQGAGIYSLAMLSVNEQFNPVKF